MKFLYTITFLFLSTLSLFAQKPDEVLAAMTGKTFTAASLSPEARGAWENRQKILAEQRQELFARQVADVLFETEAAARKTTIEKLLETEIRAKIPAPTEAEIKAVYEANQSRLGDRTLADVRAQIVAFLRQEPERRATEDFVSALKIKHKPVFVKDVNAPNLKPADVLAAVGGKTITVKDFEDKNKAAIYELEAQIFDAVENSLKAAVFSELLNAEAAELKIAPGDVIAREISDKLRDFTDEEREKLETALEQRLLTKYKVKFLIAEPAPFVWNVSVDDDPFQGSANAPATIIMFSDFQCSACAAVHPVLKRVISEYKDKTRFVVRDFPLTAIHANAFAAAQAANAANAQGKFFEYVELLYNNQNRLDDASLKEYATKIGLDRKRFDADLDSGKFASEVRKDMADGEKYGVNSTPTIFVNGVKVRNFSAAGFRRAIERALKQ
jgi:predicted DsbA family dithiol-disulfide isomerase